MENTFSWEALIAKSTRFRIDFGARACGTSVRQLVYKHLEFHLPCSRQTISTRVKKVRTEKEEKKLDAMQHALGDEIKKWEALHLPKHELEVKRIDELRAQALRDAALRGLDKPEQQFKSPHKKFPWNDPLR